MKSMYLSFIFLLSSLLVVTNKTYCMTSPQAPEIEEIIDLLTAFHISDANESAELLEALELVQSLLKRNIDRMLHKDWQLQKKNPTQQDCSSHYQAIFDLLTDTTSSLEDLSKDDKAKISQFTNSKIFLQMNFATYFIIKALTEFSDEALENMRKRLQVLANWYMKQCCSQASHHDPIIVFPEVQDSKETILLFLSQASQAVEKITEEEQAKLQEQDRIVTYEQLSQIINKQDA